MLKSLRPQQFLNLFEYLVVLFVAMVVLVLKVGLHLQPPKNVTKYLFVECNKYTFNQESIVYVCILFIFCKIIVGLAEDVMGR